MWKKLHPGREGGDYSVDIWKVEDRETEEYMQEGKIDQTLSENGWKRTRTSLSDLTPVETQWSLGR